MSGDVQVLRCRSRHVRYSIGRSITLSVRHDRAGKRRCSTFALVTYCGSEGRPDSDSMLRCRLTATAKRRLWGCRAATAPSRSSNSDREGSPSMTWITAETGRFSEFGALLAACPAQAPTGAFKSPLGNSDQQRAGCYSAESSPPVVRRENPAEFRISTMRCRSLR